MNLILFGPYGCGKGTQGKILAEKYDLQMFDTGEQLRFHIKGGTELGKKIKEIVDRGDLVSNEVVMEVIQDFIERSDKNKDYLFDGIPRFQEQANSFDELLERNNIDVKRIFLDIPRDISFARQLKRNAELVEKRADGTDEIAKKRIGIYEKETLPVVQKYIDEGRMFVVDGTKAIEEVTAQIMKVV